MFIAANRINPVSLEIKTKFAQWSLGKDINIIS